MATDRANLLTYLAGTAVTDVYAVIGRATTDTAAGLGTVLDNALRAIVGTDVDLTGTGQVGAADIPAFYAVGEALAYDKALPALAMLVDQQVDQPLTSMKLSQMYVNLSKERARLWANAADAGYGPGSLAFARINLDFKEPADLLEGY